MGGLLERFGGRRGVIAAVIAFAIAASAGWRIMQERSAVAAETELAATLDRMSSQGPMRAMYAEVRRSYPQDWQAFRQAMIDGYRADPDPQSARKISFDWGQAFMKARMSEAAASPTPELSRALAARVALTETLKTENPAACADMSWSGQIRPEDTAALSPAAMARLADYQAAVIAAAAAAKRRPATHPAATAADVAAVRAALVKMGAPANTFAVMESPDTAAHTAAEACPAGLDMTKAVSALPPEVQATFMVAMLKSTMARGAAAP